MKVVIDIPETPKNDKQRWALANGIPYEEQPHGEWIPTDEMGYMVRCSKCNYVTYEDISEEFNFCPNCGYPMISSNSKIEKSKSEIVPDYRDGWRMKEGDRDA